MAEYKGPLGASITRAEFESYKERFQKKNKDKTRFVLFDRATFQRILDHPDVANIAVYFGETEDGINTVMLLGTDKNNDPVYPTAANRGGPCPPYC
jgi:hypothetical protein